MRKPQLNFQKCCVNAVWLLSLSVVVSSGFAFPGHNLRWNLYRSRMATCNTNRRIFHLLGMTDFEKDHDDDRFREGKEAFPSGQSGQEKELFIPLLTPLELENLKGEMMLIARLSHGDKVVAEFKQHWFSERGPAMRDLLLEADFCIGKGAAYWDNAQEIFDLLLDKDPTFLEARARLSKLYCLQGRFDEAKRYSMQVLDYKPWHFVAMETMVAICTAQGDQMMAQVWKARRLPNPSKVEERRQWVERALNDAEEILRRMVQQQHKD